LLTKLSVKLGHNLLDTQLLPGQPGNSNDGFGELNDKCVEGK